MPLAPEDPATLGAYELLGRLGAGGQGTVYLARDGDGEHVAIKTLHGMFRADPSARARMAREVMAAQRVDAFCTARVLDHDIEGERPYIVSEYIDGPSLHDVVTQEGPRTGEALDRLAIGTITALAAIHQHGIVHRDFKPANVLIGPDGPRVVDFGIARAADLGLEPLTAVGAVIGTPGFLAPEQLAGEPPGPPVDVFAWGTTMIFAATGRMPGRFGDRTGDRSADLTGLTGALRELVERCRADAPGQRPQAADILLDLLGTAGGPPASRATDDILDAGNRLATRIGSPSDPPLRPPPPPAPRRAPAAPAGAHDHGAMMAPPPHGPPRHRPPARAPHPPGRAPHPPGPRRGPHAPPHGGPHGPVRHHPAQGRPPHPGPRPIPMGVPRQPLRAQSNVGRGIAIGCALLLLLFLAGCLVLGAAVRAGQAGRGVGTGPAGAEVGFHRYPAVTWSSDSRGNHAASLGI